MMLALLTIVTLVSFVLRDRLDKVTGTIWKRMEVALL